MEGVLPQAPLRARNGRVVLQLPPHLQDLANERLVGRLKALGKLLSMEPVIEIAG